MDVFGESNFSISYVEYEPNNERCISLQRQWNFKMFYRIQCEYKNVLWFEYSCEIAYIIKIICHVLKFLFHRRNNVEICRKNRNTVEEEKNNDWIAQTTGMRKHGLYGNKKGTKASLKRRRKEPAYFSAVVRPDFCRGAETKSVAA